MYEIKAIPTRYNGVQFRSRLEARWAAFFDLCGWRWDYEPFDLDGWTPDFILRVSAGVLVEIKPLDMNCYFDEAQFPPLFKKAISHADKYPILLLGVSPTLTRQGIGALKWRKVQYSEWMNAYCDVSVMNSEALWKEAGNKVQWLPR